MPKSTEGHFDQGKTAREESKSETHAEEEPQGHRYSTETAFGWAYDDETWKFEQWAGESEKNLEKAKEKFLELLKASEGKFIGVQEKGGFPLYLSKAGKQYETPSCGSAYRSFAQYTKEDIVKELSDDARPIFDDDIIQQGGINSGIEYYGGYAYDFSGETIGTTDERGGYEDLKEVCSVFDLPIFSSDLEKFLNWARQMIGKMKNESGHEYVIPEDIQQAAKVHREKK